MYRFNGKRCAANVLGVVAIAIAVAGCEWGTASAGIRKRDRVESASGMLQDVFENLPGWAQGEHPILRSRIDVERGRLWILTRDGVDLYQVETSQKVAHIGLPGWLWVGKPYSCSPDLALGPRGEAVISSNVVPTLWRIDPESFAASTHDLVLDADTDKDVGFTGLAYSAQQGAFFAVSALQGSLWRIDPLLRRAQNIPLSAALPKACGLAMHARAPGQRATRFAGVCVGTDRGDWTVSLSPDQRSGYVSPRPCAG